MFFWEEIFYFLFLKKKKIVYNEKCFFKELFFFKIKLRFIFIFIL